MILHEQENAELTSGVVLIGEVSAILGAGSEEAPECAAALAEAEALEVNMTGKVALLKGLGEVLMIDVVTKEGAQKHGEVNMTIWA